MSTRIRSEEVTPQVASYDEGGKSSSEGQNTGNDAVRPVTDDTLELLTYRPGAPSQESGGGAVGSGNQNDEAGHESRYPQRNRSSKSFYSPGSASVARAYAMLDDKPRDPSSVPEALSHDDATEWQAAIESELQSLKPHGTWEVAEHSKGMKVLSTRFVFHRKYDETGCIISHKARLVVRGFLQGNVDQTFAPVVDFTTIRTCLAIAVQKGYSIHQMVIKTAFLHGEIDGNVYVEAPEGLKMCQPGQVLKLRRGLYGLKQAPRLWHSKWDSVMKQMRFGSSAQTIASIFVAWYGFYSMWKILSLSGRWRVIAVKSRPNSRHIWM